LLKRQGGACAICCKKSTRPLCVDHCHVTRRMRGLLCRTCNLGIGHFNDDPRLLRTALAYLEAFQDSDSERVLSAKRSICQTEAAGRKEFTPN
jgi:Recombination endonuclease VII